MAEEAERQYQKAAALLSESPLPAIAALENAAECAVQRRCFGETLAHIIDIIAIVAKVHAAPGGMTFERADHLADLAKVCPPGAYSDLLSRCEVYTVLLLLLLPGR
jgi:hypothetical protein